MSSSEDRGIYELFLPVFKQGDDLQHHLEANPGDVSKAFLGLAEQYEGAARICRRVAGAIKEAPQDLVEVRADCHHIGIDGPPAAFASLVADEILTIPECPDDDDEEEEDDDSLDYNEESIGEDPDSAV